MYLVRVPLCINRLLIREFFHGFMTYVSLLSCVRLVSVRVLNSCIYSSLSLIKRRSVKKDPLNAFRRMTGALRGRVLRLSNACTPDGPRHYPTGVCPRFTRRAVFRKCG